MQADSAAFAEAHGLFAISANVARRAKRYNYAQAQPLYPPSAYTEQLRHESYGAYILSDARLDAAKRLDLLIRAVALMQVPLRIVLTSTGPERDALAGLVAQLGLTSQVELRGYVSTTELMDLYAHARAVYYAPIDEDYGFTTVQAMRASKAVVTCSDSGGTLEFVRDGHNGLVCHPDPVAIAHALDRLACDAAYAANLGAQGPASVAHVTWDRVIDSLLGGTIGAEKR
jgi:glycosyltransferase involved in cell wall biosynthesis